MKVIKFGGTSVSNAENIKKVIDIVKNKSHNNKIIVVVSALGGITNLLEQAGITAGEGNEDYKKILSDIESKHLETIDRLFYLKDQSAVKAEAKMILNELEDICHGISILEELSPKVHDLLLSFGERLSALIISKAMDKYGVPTVLTNASDLIITDDDYGNAKVDFEISNKLIKAALNNTSKNIVVPGFMARSKTGKTTTLGRGGSDYTAAIIAAAVDAPILEIWTDVDGVMTADPNLVEGTIPLEKLSYSELMEMSHFGAKVVFPPSIQPVMSKNIPIIIKNTFNPQASGTIINEQGSSNGLQVKGLSHIEKIALLTLTGSGMIGVTGIASRLFSALSAKKINVIFITQASSEHTITLAVNISDELKATKAIENEFKAEIKAGFIDNLLVENNQSIIALVGDHMKSSLGLSGKAFDALGTNGINVRAIAQGSTEKNISIVVAKKDVSKALNVLHERFFLTKYIKAHLFLVGVGNVGGTLIKQLQEQYDYLKKEYGLRLKIIGLANSKKMIFNDNYIDFKNWKEQLNEQGITMDIKAFIDKMSTLNLRNSIFVDNTANEKIASVYDKILKKSISIVASNKIASSGSYESYKMLNQTALKMRKKYLYETNVGAGLPVLKTINDMKKSGDRIIRIKAVLSGSLNFIFNNFKEGVLFSDIVKQAKEEGYTEPDPRIDLSGKDVMRKILILARESGYTLEPDDVKIKPFMPEELMKYNNINDFMNKLINYDVYFEKLRREAERQSKRLRYVAELNNGKASTSLQMTSPSEVYYQLDGKDNIVLIFSSRYNEQPLVIKGAGAGAEVTASGVFADIISIINQ
jgi:aspartokinase/homoserine dehydrogenase 1